MQTAAHNEVQRKRTALSVLGLCTVMNMLSRGIGESYAVFLLPLAREFGADRGALTGVYSTYMLFAGMMSPHAGIAFDRLGPRFCYCVGLALFGSAYALAGGRHRARNSVADRALRLARGLPRARRPTDRVAATGARAAVAAYRRRPRGARGRGEPAGGQGNTWTIARALATPAFWALFGVMFFTSVTTYAIGLQAVAYLVEIGFAPLQAASIYGLVGMISIVGMLALLEWHRAYALVAAFVLLFGTMQGSRGPLVAVLAVRNFSGDGLGTVYGTIMVGMGLGGAVGSWAAGTLHDLSGDYRAGFLLAAVCAGCGMSLFWSVRALSGRLLSAARRTPSG